MVAQKVGLADFDVMVLCFWYSLLGVLTSFVSPIFETVTLPTSEWDWFLLIGHCLTSFLCIYKYISTSLGFINSNFSGIWIHSGFLFSFPISGISGGSIRIWLNYRNIWSNVHCYIIITCSCVWTYCSQIIWKREWKLNKQQLFGIKFSFGNL